MRKYLLAGVAAVALGAPAHAALNCGAARVDVGDTSHGSVVATYVAHDPGSWVVKHTLNNGAVVDRSLQYVMTDYSGANTIQWRGTLNRNPAMTMTGELMTLKSNGQPTYDEWLYKNGQLIMHSVALCQVDTPAPYVQPPSASVPTPLAPPVAMAPPPVMAAPPPIMAASPVAPPPITTASADAVSVTMEQAGVYVPVTIGGQSVTMILDTGATFTAITNSLAASLITAGQAKEDGAPIPVTLANGSIVQERQILVNSLTIGAHTRWNVRMLVSPDGADNLPGLPVLAAIGKFTIDAANSQLLFG
jgi:clan AA aspartic protease (TIGR02281 family)